MITTATDFDTGAATHPGRVRAHNEDSFVVLPAVGVWAVADGVGGADAGEIASRAVTDALQTLGSPVSASDLLARVEDRIIRAHQRIGHIQQQRRSAAMGTTLAALLVGEGHFGCVWSGDSRVYLVRDGHITQITRDHSEVQELLDKGVITPDEAKVWPRKNVITRAIGISQDPSLDLQQGPLGAGDVFVLCSDGLTNHVEDEEIARQVSNGGGAQSACDSLVELTLERGATDNVTVVVVRYDPRAGDSAPAGQSAGVG